MNNRKVGIIGASGHVGAHVAYSLAIQGIVDELGAGGHGHRQSGE